MGEGGVGMKWRVVNFQEVGKKAFSLYMDKKSITHNHFFLHGRNIRSNMFSLFSLSACHCLTKGNNNNQDIFRCTQSLHDQYKAERAGTLYFLLCLDQSSVQNVISHLWLVLHWKRFTYCGKCHVSLHCGCWLSLTKQLEWPVQDNTKQ